MSGAEDQEMLWLVSDCVNPVRSMRGPNASDCSALLHEVSRSRLVLQVPNVHSASKGADQENMVVVVVKVEVANLLGDAILFKESEGTFA